MVDNRSGARSDGNVDVSTPGKIVQEANRIYKENFQEDYERNHRGKYAAIDVRTGRAYLGSSSDDALRKARREAPHGVFHLIRVGFRSAFRSTRFAGHHDDWIWNIS